MARQQVRQFASRYGILSTAYHLGYRIVAHASTFIIMKVVVLTMDDVDRSLLAGSDEGWGFLSREQLEAFAKADPGLDIEPGFLDKAFAHGDRCYGYVQDGVLAAYGWYTNQPTTMAPWLTIAFDPAYVYMYKGFTAPAFRGMRLHGIGMARAMQAFVQSGAKGLVSYVEADNEASLRSCERLGYKIVGTTVVAGFKRACLSFSSEGCRPYGFRVKVGTAGSKRLLPA